VGINKHLEILVLYFQVGRHTTVPLSVENVDRCHESLVDEAFVADRHHRQNAIQNTCTEIRQVELH